MRFMMLVKSAENSGPPPKALMDAIGKMAEEATKAGLMLQSGGLAPTAMSSRVRLSQGKLTTIDGPFAESKEVVGGFAVFEFKSREEAIESAVNFMELHKQHWPGWDGETEVRQIVAIHRCSCALCTVNRARTTTATNEGRFVLRGAAPQLYPLRAA
jgi:hypothetical protein